MKALYAATLFLIFAASVSAQSVMLDLTGGYCAPIASSYMPVSSTHVEISTPPFHYATYYSMRPVSYGQGGSLALNINWFSKKDIGLGLRLNAMFSSPFARTLQLSDLSGTSANLDIREKAFSFQFVPHISFKHDFKVVTPILEMGMVIGVTHVSEEYDEVYSTGDIIQSTVRNHGGAMIGFYSSLGLAFRVSRVVRIMVAVNCTAGSYSPTGWDRTSFIVNGQDRLGDLSTGDLHGIYVKELNPTAQQSPSATHQDVKYAEPFSNVGFVAGIGFNFTSKKSRAATGATKKDNGVIHPF